METLGDLINRSRGDLTQEQLGRRIGVHQSTVANWVSGRRLPTRANMVQLAAALQQPLVVVSEAVLETQRRADPDVLRGRPQREEPEEPAVSR